MGAQDGMLYLYKKLGFAKICTSTGGGGMVHLPATSVYVVLHPVIILLNVYTCISSTAQYIQHVC